MSYENIHYFRCKQCGAQISDPAQFKPILCASCYRKKDKKFGLFGA